MEGGFFVDFYDLSVSLSVAKRDFVYIIHIVHSITFQASEFLFGRNCMYLKVSSFLILVVCSC